MTRMGDTEDGSYDLSSVPCACWRDTRTHLLSAGLTWQGTNTLLFSFALDAARR